MHKLACLLILILFVSCNFFENKKLNAEDLLHEDLKTFDWNAIDMYPKFRNCNAIIDKSESKVCFQNHLLKSVNSYLESQNIIVSKDVNDTIKVKITVNNKGYILLDSIFIKPETQLEIPEIENLLRQSIKNLPQLQPATKRGQEVSTSFELPVLLKIL